MGAAASTIPMHIDKETFRRLSGGTVNDALFDANSENGIMSRDKLFELSQLRDCFLSHDYGNDIYNRDIHARVMRINQALKAKGLLTWFDDIKPRNDQIVARACSGIDRSRSLVCFLTKGYVEKVIGNYPADNCHVEFSYTIAKKHPSYIVPVVFEEPLLNQSNWPGKIGLALGKMPFLNFVDDNNFDQKIDDLYQRIIRISKSTEPAVQVEASNHNSVLSQVNKSKEEQQFFQWLARSTNIDENRRMIYCASLVKSGVNNVFTLAKTMNNNPTFLTSLGIHEYDADQIALAVRDLGLGYAPVKDFDKALTIESVVYALRKSSQQSEDPTLAESALSCAARVAASNPILPTVMSDAGICEAVLKLMQRNLAHAPSMEYGCLAIYSMTINNIEIAEKFGSLTACDVLPRTMKSHLESPNVILNGSLAIASLARIKENRQKFCNTGACDVLVKAMVKCIQFPDVIEQCFLASNKLSITHTENVSKLGAAGGSEACILALRTHPTHPTLVDQVFEFIGVLSVDPTCRVILGGQEPSAMAIVGALTAQVNNPNAFKYGCAAISVVIMGNSFNRNILAKYGACEAVRTGFLNFQNDIQIVQMACRAMFSLAAGNPETRMKFQGLQPILQKYLNIRDLPEPIRADLKEAALKIQ